MGGVGAHHHCPAGHKRQSTPENIGAKHDIVGIKWLSSSDCCWGHDIVLCPPARRVCNRTMVVEDSRLMAFVCGSGPRAGPASQHHLIGGRSEVETGRTRHRYPNSY